MTTSPPRASPTFAVVPGRQVAEVLSGHEREVTDLIEQTYRRHGAGRTVNPRSYFLRFEDRPDSRIIALPASISSGRRLDGLKWISSFPGNVASGLPRASAVLILNDPETGYPFACLESSIVSASRTAASAALAADRLSRSRTRPVRLGVVGAGLIARYIHRYLHRTGWVFDEIGVHDLVPGYAGDFGTALRRDGHTGRVQVHQDAESLIRSSDLVVFATVAGSPHVHEPAWFEHAPLVLHVSLRDLSPEVITASVNIVDDVEHCLTAATSVHLTEQRLGHRGFIDGTLDDVLTGGLDVPGDRTVVFSPFGLGVLDLALGGYIHDRIVTEGRLATVPGFFSELDRYDRSEQDAGTIGVPLRGRMRGADAGHP